MVKYFIASAIICKPA